MHASLHLRAAANEMIKIPYGESNFKTLMAEGYHYVDRTGFIRVLESLGARYLFFLRPRRFGKSLWISTLEHYYGEEHKPHFPAIFGQLDIGQNPTPLANTYLVLRLQFSGIDTSSETSTHRDFLRNTLVGIESFIRTYSDYYEATLFDKIKEAISPADAISSFFQMVENETPDRKVYLLIDEYDHFANELISFNLEHFKTSVSQNGWVRKFYEIIKDATGNGTLHRIFITGVSPLTLDSMTSGFNIGTHLSLDSDCHDMMGFREADVRTILTGVGVPDAQLDTAMKDVADWYDGYLFSTEAEHRLYNSDMVLYFAEQYRKRQKYPQRLLDTNISSDYSKISRLFSIGDQEANYAVLQKMLDERSVNAEMTAEFSFAKTFTTDNFISLLFYMGLLTIDSGYHPVIFFRIPNYVIRELYFQYFFDLTLQRMEMDRYKVDVTGIALALARDNNPRPAVAFIESVLKKLSFRDAMNFDEKHIKMIFAALLHSIPQFYIKSEYEVQNGYIDLVLLRYPANPPHHQLAIELKFIKKSEPEKLEAKIAEAKGQLVQYRQDPFLKEQPKFHAWAFVFVGEEARFVEEV